MACSSPERALSGADAHFLRSAEGDVGVEGELLARAELQPGEAAGEFLDGQPGLELPEVAAQAVVQALAEGQVLVSVRAAQIEPFRFGKYRGSRPVAPSQRNSRA
jgi:hypothetical protein